MERKYILWLIFLILIIASAFKPNEESKYKYISVKEYKDAVYASWIGQIIGNTYGLGYEFKFIDQPGPDKFPYGYSFTIDDLKKYDGAYSDDDTDIEYMYLIEMEKNGTEPSYYNLAEAWKKHVKKRVWFANRMALTLMHAGHYPPVTGKAGYNYEWFQIDPQLVNEIWAVTSPGMINYAVAKSEYAARITSDSFGLEPTMHYAAMYSAAFFEKDIAKLVDIGTSALPQNSRFALIVEHVKDLHKTYPKDWQKAREIVKNNYYTYADYNKHTWAAVDANLNGALGIMALLYGDGDFWKTLDYCCAFGMDADNQSATMCGLLGIVNGFKSIPHELMFPLKDAHWEKPFNDQYKMITREGLTDASIFGMVERMVSQAEKIIQEKGGSIINRKGASFYKINTSAKFVAPFELNPIPQLVAEFGKKFSYPLYTGRGSKEVKISVSGNKPTSIIISNSEISGIPDRVGKFQFIITAICDKEKKSIPVEIVVHSENLATKASKVLCSDDSSKDIEVLRDTDIAKTYYSKKGKEKREDYYGYEWSMPQEISALTFNNGASQEFGGWFTSLYVEILKDGKWQKLEDVKIQPEINFDNSQWLKPEFMNYHFTFPTVTTAGIRIIGFSGGIEKDAANANLGIEYYTSVAELAVYKE